MVWKIVEFNDKEHSISCVPHSWLIENERKCFWPNFTDQLKFNKAVMKLQSPSPSWKAYDVFKVLSTTNSYVNGIQKVKECMHHSDVNTGDEAKTKRKDRDKKKRSMSLELEEDTFRNSLSCSKTSVWPSFPAGTTSTTKNIDLSNSNEDQGIYLQENSSDGSTSDEDLVLKKMKKNCIKEVELKKQMLTLVPAAVNNINVSANVCNEDLLSIIGEPAESFQNNTFSNTGLITPAEENVSELKQVNWDYKNAEILEDVSKNNILDSFIDFDEVVRKLNKVSQVQDQILEKITIIEKKLNHSENYSTVLNSTSKNNHVEDLVINRMPFSSNKDFDQFESALENKKFFRDTVGSLKLIGGNDVSNIIFNILSRLMTNQLAEKYSFAGIRSGKLSFKSTLAFKLLLATVRCRNTQITDSEISIIVGKWLIQAKMRRERYELKIKNQNLKLLAHQELEKKSMKNNNNENDYNSDIDLI